MKSLWIPAGYSFLNATYHQNLFALARQGRSFEELGDFRQRLFTDHLTPGRFEVMTLWEFLTRTRFDDELGPIEMAAADQDTKFAEVRALWLAAGNPQIRTDGEQIQLAAVVGLAAMDVPFRDALLAAGSEAEVHEVIEGQEPRWGRYVLNGTGELRQLNAFVQRLRPMGRANPLEIFHEKTWVQPRSTGCPVGVSGDLGYSHLSHSAFERTRCRAGGPPLGMEMLADAQVVDLVGTLRAAGILIERE